MRKLSINRIRIINFIYSGGQNVVQDETFEFYNGKSALLNMANGGGKTSLIHFILNGIKPKAEVGNRKIESYFEKQNNTAHAMIEWSLSDNGGYVLTGICARRNLNQKDKGINFFTYLLEYDEENSYDIKHIPLIEEINESEEILKRVIPYEKIEDHLRNASQNHHIRFFKVYSEGSQSLYKKDMQKYGLYQSELKLIEKINEGEGSLVNIFENDKKSRKIIEKWIIPNIEAGMQVENEKQTNVLVENLNQNIDKFIKYKREKLNIQEYRQFKNKIDELVKEVENYHSSLFNYKTICNEIFSIRSSIESLIGELNNDFEKLNNKKSLFMSNLHNEEYLKESFEYRLIEKNFLILQKQFQEINIIIFNLEEKEQSFTEEKVIQEAAQIYEEVVENRRNFDLTNHKLDVLNKANEEIILELNNVRYSISRLYKKIIDDNDKSINNKECNSRDIKTQINSIESLKENIRNKKEEKVSVIASCKEKIKLFEKKKREIYKLIAKEGFIEPNTAKEEIQKELQSIKSELENNKIEIDKNIKKFDKRQNEEKLLKEDEQNLKNKGDSIDRRIKVYQEDLIKIIEVITKYSIIEKNLFETNANLMKLNNFIDECKEQKYIYDKKINKIGKIISSIIEENYNIPQSVQQILDINNIDYSLGSEWLYKATLNRKVKEEFLDKNPLMPYSLIIGRNEVEKLGKIRFKDTVNFAIPLIIKEEMMNDNSRMIYNQIAVINEGINFITSYDRKMVIDKDNILQHKEQLINERKDLILNSKKVDDRISQLIVTTSKLNEFYAKYDKLYFQDVCNEKQVLLKNKEAIKEVITNTVNDEVNLKESIKQLTEYREKLINNKGNAQEIIEKLNRFCEDEKEYNKIVIIYKDATTENEIINAKINSYSTEQKNLNKHLDRLKDEISFLKNERSNTKEDMKKYIGYISGEIINKDLIYLRNCEESLEDQLNNTDNDRERQFLDNQKNSICDQLDKLMRKLTRYKEFEHKYKNTKYDEYYLADLEIELNEIKLELKAKRDDKIEVAKSNSSEETKLDEKAKQIKKNYGNKEPACFNIISEDVFQTICDRIISYSNQIEGISEQIMEIDEKLKKYTNLQSQLIGHIEGQDEPEIFKDGELIRVDFEQLNDTRKFLKLKIDDYKKLKKSYRSSKEQVMSIRESIFREFEYSYLETICRFKIKLSSNKFVFNYNTLDKHVQIFKQKIDEAIQLVEDATKRVEKDKDLIVDFCNQFVLKVYNELKIFDSKSMIHLSDDKGVQIPQKMLKLKFPHNIDSMIIKTKTSGYIDRCIEEISYLKSEKEENEIKRILKEKLSGKCLIDNIIGLDRFHLSVYKVKAYLGNSDWVDWDDIAKETSGAERFSGIFYLFMTIMAYIRSKNISNNYKKNFNANKVLIMDNPFGTITSDHLLKPVFQYARKFNTQLICFTDLQNNAIYDQFKLIYGLQIVTTLDGKGYLTKIVKKGEKGVEVDSKEKNNMKLEQIRFIEKDFPL